MSKQASLDKQNKNEQQIFVDKMMADFDRADLDGDGSMDFSEYVRKAWGELEQDEMPLTLRQLRGEFRKCDLNGDGRISRQEFKYLAEKCFLAATRG